MKKFLMFVAILLGFSFLTSQSFSEESPFPEKDIYSADDKILKQLFADELLPEVKANPNYPRKAMERGIEGGVTVEYTVDKQGNTKDIVIIKEIPEGFGFGPASIEAARQYKYPITIINNKPVEIRGMRTSIYFSLSWDIPREVIQGLATVRRQNFDNPEGNLLGTDANGENFTKNRYLPAYVPYLPHPKKALKEEIEGKVIVSFTVTKKGTVKDIIIIEETPKGFGFGKAAKKAVKDFIFLPRLVDGKTVEVQDMEQTIAFCLPNQNKVCS